jgi:hypothetical protein
VPDELRRLAQTVHDALEALAAKPAGNSGDPSPDQAALQTLDDAREAYAVYYGYCEQVARTSAVAVRRDQKRKDAEVIHDLERKLELARRAAPDKAATRSLAARVRRRLRRRRASL